MTKLNRFKGHQGPYVVLFKYKDDEPFLTQPWEFGYGFNNIGCLDRRSLKSEDPLIKHYGITSRRASIHSEINSLFLPSELVKAVQEIIICSVGEEDSLNPIEHLQNEFQIKEYMKNVVDS